MNLLQRGRRPKSRKNAENSAYIQQDDAAQQKRLGVGELEALERSRQRADEIVDELVTQKAANCRVYERFKIALSAAAADAAHVFTHKNKPVEDERFVAR